MNKTETILLQKVVKEAALTIASNMHRQIDAAESLVRLGILKEDHKDWRIHGGIEMRTFHLPSPVSRSLMDEHSDYR